MICQDTAYDILSKPYPFSTKRNRNCLFFIICKVTNTVYSCFVVGYIR